jgi:polyisoprenoid-binding protein YceI
MRYSLLIALLAMLPVSAFAETLRYTIDAVHSGVDFRVRHFLNRVPGTFGRFSGEIHFDPANPANSKTFAVIDASSVDTRNERRDDHLRNPDYFNTELHPSIRFTSERWEVTGDNTFKIHGQLEIMGKSLPVVIDAVYLGEMEGRGVMRSGWEGKLTIDRTAWGLTHGAGVVGNQVEIELNIQAHRPLDQ